jgi:hypothetical protein
MVIRSVGGVSGYDVQIVNETTKKKDFVCCHDACVVINDIARDTKRVYVTNNYNDKPQNLRYVSKVKLLLVEAAAAKNEQKKKRAMMNRKSV